MNHVHDVAAVCGHVWAEQEKEPTQPAPAAPKTAATHGTATANTTPLMAQSGPATIPAAIAAAAAAIGAVAGWQQQTRLGSSTQLDGRVHTSRLMCPAGMVCGWRMQVVCKRALGVDGCHAGQPGARQW